MHFTNKKKLFIINPEHLNTNFQLCVNLYTDNYIYYIGINKSKLILNHILIKENFYYSIFYNIQSRNQFVNERQFFTTMVFWGRMRYHIYMIHCHNSLSSTNLDSYYGHRQIPRYYWVEDGYFMQNVIIFLKFFNNIRCIIFLDIQRFFYCLLQWLERKGQLHLKTA